MIHLPERPPYVVAMPRINEPAPDFTATTTHGPRSLADYKGRWLVLFSHPADFTPVCTTEFLGFSEQAGSFQNIGCDLLGLSVDSNTSHLAWVRNIKEKFDIDVPFPIIADASQRVAQAYGMIHPDADATTTVRATFVIDPKGIVRAIVYYPMTTGRSVSEILRLVQALQTTDKHTVSTPEGWNVGDDIILPPPQTVADAESRVAEGHECADWYYCKAPLDAVSKKKKGRIDRPPVSR